MAMKMDRRAFLKTSAAMAVAVSMTGLLGGCSDGDGSTKFGRFQATVGALREKDNAMVGGVAAEWKGDVMVRYASRIVLRTKSLNRYMHRRIST